MFREKHLSLRSSSSPSRPLRDVYRRHLSPQTQHKQTYHPSASGHVESRAFHRILRPLTVLISNNNNYYLQCCYYSRCYLSWWSHDFSGMDVTSHCGGSDITESGANQKPSQPEAISSQPAANGTLPHHSAGEMPPSGAETFHFLCGRPGNIRLWIRFCDDIIFTSKLGVT